MDRRRFLKCAAITVCSLLFEGGLNTLLSAQKVPEKADLVVARGAGKTPTAITKAAIDAMGGINKFISQGDIVVIKPNMSWDRLPEQAGNTNPEVVET